MDYWSLQKHLRENGEELMEKRGMNGLITDYNLHLFVKPLLIYKLHLINEFHDLSNSVPMIVVVEAPRRPVLMLR